MSKNEQVSNFKFSKTEKLSMLKVKSVRVFEWSISIY